MEKPKKSPRQRIFFIQLSLWAGLLITLLYALKTYYPLALLPPYTEMTRWIYLSMPLLLALMLLVWTWRRGMRGQLAIFGLLISVLWIGVFCMFSFMDAFSIRHCETTPDQQSIICTASSFTAAWQYTYVRVGDLPLMRLVDQEIVSF